MFPARKKSEPNSFLADDQDSFRSEDYKVIVVSVSKTDDNVVNCAIQREVEDNVHGKERNYDALPGNHVMSRDVVRDNELSYLVEEVSEVGDDDTTTELKVEAVHVGRVER